MLRENVGDWFGFTDPEYSDSPSLDEELFDILNKIKHLPNISMEVCGTWLWVTGDTKPVHDTLKEHGLKYAPKKVAWYWRPEGYRKRGGKPWEMNAIRARYGSQDIDTEPTAQVMG